jgi:hypothetical protein
VPACPSCHRPVAIVRATCLYCGEPLPPTLLAELSPGGPDDDRGPRPTALDATPDRPSRVLLVLDLQAAKPAALGEGLGLSLYEAELLRRRGGFHLHRVLDEEAGRAETRRLQAAGLPVEVLPESEARVRPLRALGGECGWGSIALRTEEEPVTLRRQDLLIIVQGPIAREYQPVYRRRKVDVASLEEGYRVHFHRHSDPRPVEIDGYNFEFGFTVTGSTRLELDAWVEAVSKGIPRDDGFRRIPPAFGVAELEAKGPLAAASALGRTSRGRDTLGEGESVVLDNAAQFAFYSGWRAALERRRAR